MATSLVPVKVAVGIDLGTTHSCVAVYRNGNVEIIANDIGNRLTPSYVAFTDIERLIGEGAKSQASVNYPNTIFEIKRLIGRHFHDETVQADVKKWPFKVVEKGDIPNVEIIYKHQTKTFTPEQISSMILTKLKETADAFLGVSVKDVVITVPAYFTDSQRQATIDAGQIANLNVLKVINEPTAAAIAYGIDQKIVGKRNILVFDLGGGTFDVAILSVSKGNFEVKAVGGDTHLGGGDFDVKLVDHFLGVIMRKYGKDVSNDHRVLGRLKSACEIVKIKLSSSVKASIDIDCLFDGKDFQSSITRFRFEELCSEQFEKTIEHVESTLTAAKMSKEDIADVVLVGGSTRIPKVQQLLGIFFNEKKLTKTINPDEAVAYGAAVQAAIMSGDNSIEDHTLEDVIPLSIGVRVADGTVKRGLHRNTKIPVTNTIKLTTHDDYQKGAAFDIYEGERQRHEHNTLLGSFSLENIQIARRGVPKLMVTFSIDENGILHTSAIDEKTNDSNGITITTNKGRLNEVDIDRMIGESKQMIKDDRIHQKRTKLQNELESLCLDFNATLDTETWRNKEHVSLSDTTLQWLEENQEASLESYRQKIKDVRSMRSHS